MLHKLIAAAVLVSLPAAAMSQIPDALREAARQAVVASPDVQVSWHAFRAAAEEQGVARGGYLPQLDFSASTGAERQTRPGRGTDSFNHSGASLSLNQMVYDGFFTRSEVARLGHAKLARYFELIDASENAALEAMRAYADVLRYRELVRLAQENYVQHRQIHQQIAERAAAGVGRRVDLEQATGRLALAESNLLTEVSNLHDVSARFLRIVGSAPPETLAPIGARIATGVLPSTASGALQEAFAASPALHAAVQNVQASQAQVEARRAALQPRLDLRARQSVDNNLDGVSGNSRDGVVEVVLSYNLFRGGSDTARVRQAAESLNQAKDLREKACRDLRQTLSIAYNDVLRLEEQLRYLDQHQLSIEKAREAYRSQFDIGQRTLLDLLDTENEYFQARRAYVSAQADHQIAQGRALAGMGRLMRTLDVAREDLPPLADLGHDGAPIDPATICPPEATAVKSIDKDAVFASAIKSVGAKSVVSTVPAANVAPEADNPTRALESAVSDWAKAWESKDFSRYRSFYAVGFAPAEGQTTGAWEALRRQRLNKPGAIRVGVSQLRVEQVGPEKAVTTFVQDYRSDDYSDVVTKRLEWVRADGRWVIQKETVQ